MGEARRRAGLDDGEPDDLRLREGKSGGRGGDSSEVEESDEDCHHEEPIAEGRKLHAVLFAGGDQ